MFDRSSEKEPDTACLDEQITRSILEVQKSSYSKIIEVDLVSCNCLEGQLHPAQDQAMEKRKIERGRRRFTEWSKKTST